MEEVTDEPLYRDRVCGIDIGKAQMVATIRVPSDKDPARAIDNRLDPQPVVSALDGAARRRTGVKNGCGTARDVVLTVVR